MKAKSGRGRGALAFLTVALVILFSTQIFPAIPAFPGVPFDQTGAAGEVSPGSGEGESQIDPSSYVPDEVVVTLKGDIGEALRGLRKKVRYFLHKEESHEAILSRQLELPAPRVVKLKLQLGIDARVASQLISRLPEVEIAEPNYLFHVAATVPNDPRYIPDQENLRQVNADDAWDGEKGTDALTLAVIDTGVDYNHLDLAGRCVPGYDFVNDDSDPMDDNNHGTAVASIAAAATNNGYWMAGTCWYGKIMPLKALDSSGTGEMYDVIQAIHYAADQGAKIINMSFTNPTPSSQLQQAIDYAYSRGCLMVAAVGNEGSSQVNYPAGCDHVIGAGSVGTYPPNRDVRSSFSNYNWTVDLVAPGENVPSLRKYPPYYGTNMTGTSLSAPHVAGAALLLWSHYPTLGSEEVEFYLERGAQDLGAPGRDDYYGYGRLDIFRAIFWLEVSIDSPPPSSFPASGHVTATATSHGSTVNLMELRVDGNLVDSASVSGNPVTYEFTKWDFSPMSEGGHLIEVRATDVIGNQASTQAWYFRNQTHPRPSDTWYLAEGCTAFGFDTFVLIQNPNDEGVIVDITYMLPAGPQPRDPLYLPPRSRTTIGVNGEVVKSDVSTFIKARDGKAVVAERAMYWNGMSAGHSSIGVNAPSTTWYLAEGTTAYGFEEFVLVQNPNVSETAQVKLEFMKPDGSNVPPYRLEVPPQSRRTVSINSVVPNAELSVKVESENGVPIIAERAMYWGNRSGGHDSIGVTEPSDTWYLTEGCTAYGFKEFVLVQNPHPTSSTRVTFNFLIPSGSPIVYTKTIGPKTRFTLNVADVVGEKEVSTFIYSLDLPVVAERAMYWNNFVEGHVSIGSSTPAHTWYLAEGCTAHGFTEYLLLSNPNDQPAYGVVLSLMLPGGAPVGDYVVNLPAKSRQTICVNNLVRNSDVSVRVSSTGYPINVERAMYWNNMRGGTDSIGAMLP